MEHPFLRNEMLWGPEAQARLARAHVLLLGLGGVGSYAAECLARSGVGELTLVDSDTIAAKSKQAHGHIERLSAEVNGMTATLTDLQGTWTGTASALG